MAVKSSTSRLTLPAPLGEYMAERIEHGYRVLTVEWTHAAAVERMACHHRDPSIGSLRRRLLPSACRS
jgi:PIN domain nuclease of toxin-antitoxin system